MIVRGMAPGEAGLLAEIFYRSVHEGAAAAYTPAERRAWAPEQPSPAAWAARLQGLQVWVAARAGRPVGFMALTEAGYLDLAFVLPDERGQGTAALLYQALETAARRQGLVRLTSEASHLARPFLTRRGWHEIRRQTVRRNGVDLTNFQMEKRLADPPAGSDPDPGSAK